MDNNLILLHELPKGSMGKVIKLNSMGASRRRMLDLGLIVGTNVRLLRKSPQGDPIAYRIRGSVIAFRLEESSKIIVEKI